MSSFQNSDMSLFKKKVSNSQKMHTSQNLSEIRPVYTI